LCPDASVKFVETEGLYHTIISATIKRLNDVALMCFFKEKDDHDIGALRTNNSCLRYIGLIEDDEIYWMMFEKVFRDRSVLASIVREDDMIALREQMDEGMSHRVI
jgi:hypothetical protein